MAAAGALLPMPASAQFKNQGYLTDTQGGIVRAIGAGVCVRTSDWTPARAVAECDPDLVKKPAPPKVVPKPKPEAKPEVKPKPKPKPEFLNIEEKI
jgi:OOP family OmpA-OmpF porin